MNKLDFTNDLLTKQITKLEEDALKPMSILEIKEKFNLSFPFKVKRVKQSINPELGLIFEFSIINEIIKTNPGYGTNNVITQHNKRWRQDANVQDYILFEEN